ncbi:MAG TPA: cytochrome c [Gemmataceae bacterium]|nr:cytochrome c [Gemmataceae bacterium]
MKRRAAITLTGAVLALGLWSMTAYSADDEEKQARLEAQKAILKLADSMRENKGDTKAQAAAIKKKFDELQPLMWIYKPKNKGGIGMKDGAGIELELGRLGGPKARLTPAKIADLKLDLVKAAEISKAIAEISDLYAPKKDTAKWKGYNKEMRKAADELIEATKGGNPMQVKRAINNLNASCTNCHGDFRE